jgi:hypothetical protein
MKVVWLSKRQSEKRVGSLVIWLKQPAAADHFSHERIVRFRTSEAFCSKFERREGFDLCYNCNGYGHKQTNCTNKTKCGICSNPHNIRNCSQRTTPKCPACLGPHPIFNRKCRFHLRHITTDGEQESTGKGASKQRPTFGPTLPPGMARERREASMNVDADMMDELG